MQKTFMKWCLVKFRKGRLYFMRVVAMFFKKKKSSLVTCFIAQLRKIDVFCPFNTFCRSLK